MEKSGTHDLEANSIVVPVDADWLRNYALDFLNAAKAVPAPKSRFLPVQYFLACRSIELSLKSLLMAFGTTKAELKGQIGHDLGKALDRINDLGISGVINLSSEEKQAIFAANSIYSKKGFEYFESLDLVYGEAEIPDLSALLDIAERLVDAIAAPVRQSAFGKLT
jgi:hypothetical protein